MSAVRDPGIATAERYGRGGISVRVSEARGSLGAVWTCRSAFWAAHCAARDKTNRIKSAQVQHYDVTAIGSGRFPRSSRYFVGGLIWGYLGAAAAY